MTKLDSVTLEKIGREVQLMPPEGRALVYRAIPELSRAHAAVAPEDLAEPTDTSYRAEEARSLSPLWVLEQPVAAATSASDWTTLTSLPVLGRVSVGGEDAPNSNLPGPGAQQTLPSDLSTRSKESPVFVAGRKDMQPPATFSSRVRAAKRHSKPADHRLFLVLSSAGLVLLLFAASGLSWERRSFPPPARPRLPIITPGPAVPNVIFETTTEAVESAPVKPAAPEPTAEASRGPAIERNKSAGGQGAISKRRRVPSSD